MYHVIYHRLSGPSSLGCRFAITCSHSGSNFKCNPLWQTKRLVSPPKREQRPPMVCVYKRKNWSGLVYKKNIELFRNLKWRQLWVSSFWNKTVYTSSDVWVWLRMLYNTTTYASSDVKCWLIWSKIQQLTTRATSVTPLLNTTMYAPRDVRCSLRRSELQQ